MRKLALCATLALLLAIITPITAAAVDPEELLSQAAILIDADTGQVLYEKNGRDIMFPASTTKIMTALLVIETTSPDEMVTVTQSALEIDEPDSSNIALSAGEQLSVRDALYALMLPSANDAANVLAEHVAGSQEAFAAMMTQRAHEIGATDTYYTNPHGLHEDGHYTTAYDLALITRHAMTNPNFAHYFGTDRYTMPGTNLQPLERPFTNYQHMLVPDTYYYYEHAVGGKTGYTTEAGHTMSTVATKNGRTLVCVVLNSAHRDDKFEDTWALLDYGFDQFQTLTLPAETFDAVTLPLVQEGEAVGKAVFRYNEDFPLLLHRDINPEAVQVRYQVPEVYDLDDIQAANILIALDGDGLPAGTPTTLVTLDMAPEVSVDIYPVSALPGDPIPLPSLQTGEMPGWLPWLLLVPAAAVVLVVMATIQMRRRKLKKRHLARQAARHRARQEAMRNTARRSAYHRSNVYQARR